MHATAAETALAGQTMTLYYYFDDTRENLSEGIRTNGSACIIATTVALGIYIGTGNYLRIHDGHNLVWLLIKMEFST
ncbi:hypothetical protein [Chryseobacterium sp. CBTAP 102]|uniref:hypothetical protein n=1 Tax=Chryseobacterium sp. CBTAP 102 TaxID=2135644 RepID=UPI0011B4B05D|nr:hypothetical protein [Chryseobacterium sp. CBTAP 102]